MYWCFEQHIIISSQELWSHASKCVSNSETGIPTLPEMVSMTIDNIGANAKHCGQAEEGRLAMFACSGT